MEKILVTQNLGLNPKHFLVTKVVGVVITENKYDGIKYRIGKYRHHRYVWRDDIEIGNILDCDKDKVVEHKRGFSSIAESTLLDKKDQRVLKILPVENCYKVYGLIDKKRRLWMDLGYIMDGITQLDWEYERQKFIIA
jgi:hypothetical protein